MRVIDKDLAPRLRLLNIPSRSNRPSEVSQFIPTPHSRARCKVGAGQSHAHSRGPIPRVVLAKTSAILHIIERPHSSIDAYDLFWTAPTGLPVVRPEQE